MGYRKLTKAEALELVNQMPDEGVAEELDEYKQRWSDFARKYFGPTAYRIRVRTDSEYNDEGYSNEIIGVSVYDRNGKRLQVTRATASAHIPYHLKGRTVDDLDFDDLEDIGNSLASTMEPPVLPEDLEDTDEAEWCRNNGYSSAPLDPVLNYYYVKEPIELYVKE